MKERGKSKRAWRQDSLSLKSKKRVQESAGNLALRPTGRALQPQLEARGDEVTGAARHTSILSAIAKQLNGAPSIRTVCHGAAAPDSVVCGVSDCVECPWPSRPPTHSPVFETPDHLGYALCSSTHMGTGLVPRWGSGFLSTPSTSHLFPWSKHERAQVKPQVPQTSASFR